MWCWGWCIDGMTGQMTGMPLEWCQTIGHHQEDAWGSADSEQAAWQPIPTHLNGTLSPPSSISLLPARVNIYDGTYTPQSPLFSMV